MADIDPYRESLRPWRMMSEEPIPMVVDVRLHTSRLAPDQVVVGCAPGAAGTRTVELGGSATPPILLERWTIAMQYVSMLTRPGRHDVRLPAVYKRAIVHFRALYALARALPAYALCRKIQKGEVDGLDVEIAVHSTASLDDLGEAKSWALEGVATPNGTLACHVHYKACSELRVETRGSAAACKNVALPTPPSAPTRARSRTLGTSPSRATEPAFAAPSRRRGDVRASLRIPSESAIGSPSPLMRCMWSAKEGTSPQSQPLRRRLSISTEQASPEGLRSLFQTYTAPRAQLGMSPSSLWSLRTPPQGGFDLYMRRRAEASPSGSLQGISEGASGAAQPQRIQRYARQPSYRQRDYSRSLGGAGDDTTGSARSWSQRLEHRRMMERGAARESVGSLPRSQLSASPGASRLFTHTAPSHNAAFALTKPRAPAANDDLMELVQMLDAPPALHELPERRSLGRSPSSMPLTPRSSLGAPAEKGDIDDVLAKLAASVKLHAMDEAFGGRPEPPRTLPRPIRIQSRPPMDTHLDQDTGPLDLAFEASDVPLYDARGGKYM